MVLYITCLFFPFAGLTFMGAFPVAGFAISFSPAVIKAIQVLAGGVADRAYAITIIIIPSVIFMAIIAERAFAIRIAMRRAALLGATSRPASATGVGKMRRAETQLAIAAGMRIIRIGHICMFAFGIISAFRAILIVAFGGQAMLLRKAAGRAMMVCIILCFKQIMLTLPAAGEAYAIGFIPVMSEFRIASFAGMQFFIGSFITFTPMFIILACPFPAGCAFAIQNAGMVTLVAAALAGIASNVRRRPVPPRVFMAGSAALRRARARQRPKMFSSCPFANITVMSIAIKGNIPSMLTGVAALSAFAIFP